jgi:phosphopantothenate---cysteine ligase (CTP)
MKLIVTTGPSYEPIDEVRRLTNFSTGELGVRLANELSRAGFEVFCLRGVAATYPAELQSAHASPFTTNADLAGQLVRLAKEHEIRAVFHAAALCDFKVADVLGPAGPTPGMAKIDSRVEALSLRLEPAKKVLGELRTLFPAAILVGWKYELDGSRADAEAKAWRQLRENRTDACVLNGRAYGPGFGWCTPPAEVLDLPDRASLIEFVPRWLRSRMTEKPAR